MSHGYANPIVIFTNRFAQLTIPVNCKMTSLLASHNPTSSGKTGDFLKDTLCYWMLFLAIYLYCTPIGQACFSISLDNPVSARLDSLHTIPKLVWSGRCRIEAVPVKYQDEKDAEAAGWKWWTLWRIICNHQRSLFCLVQGYTVSAHFIMHHTWCKTVLQCQISSSPLLHYGVYWHKTEHARLMHW